MVRLIIDGKEIMTEEKKTILQVAREEGIDIPTLCYDKDLSIFGGCRLCVVEVEGFRNLVASCSVEISDGMVVQTESNRVVQARKTILELLLENHPNDCLTCQKAGDCELQAYAYRYEVRFPENGGERKQYPIESLNPVMERDQSKCILCGKCVRVCREIQCTTAIEFVGRGFDSKIATGFDLPIDYKNCRLCGQCISMCPTGALQNKQFKGVRPFEKITKTRTTCPFCGTGCTFDLNVQGGKVIGVTPTDEAPVNGKSLCVKGRYHTDLITSETRLKTPLIKKDGVFVEASWEEAMNLVVTKLKEIKEEFGPDSIAGLSSARCVNEDNFVFQKMMRVAIGTNNVDHCART